MTQVAIIGCGPAGLLAAHAAVVAGHTPVVYSHTTQPSPMAGGVYLHAPVPGITDRRADGLVQFIKLGPGSGYAAKVYGDPHAQTSWGVFTPGARPAWALQPAYEALWRLYGGSVRRLWATPDVAAQLAHDYPLVFSSAPLEALCTGGHKFPSRPVWYVDRAPAWVKDNQMVYNGEEDIPWFRASRVFGHAVMEFSREVRYGQPRVGCKVLKTDCTCHPTIVRIGRWGTWQPGQLLHHAYRAATDALHKL